MRVKSYLTTVLPLVLLPAAVFGATAAEVLMHAESADEHVSYRGVKTARMHLSKGFRTSTMKVVHLRPDKTRTEFFSPAAVAGMIFIEDGPFHWRFSPRESLWEQACPRSFPRHDVIRREAFHNYEIQIIGTERIAGRETYVVHAIPSRHGETARRVWVDKQWYLVMGTQVESADGEVVNSSRYLTIEMNPKDILPSIFKVSGKVRAMPKPPDVPFEALKPSYLPEGYKLVGNTGLKVCNRVCAHLQFSNGVNTISLFQRQAGKDTPPTPIGGKTPRGLSWSQKGMLLTLIGDISYKELQKIAASVK